MYTNEIEKGWEWLGIIMKIVLSSWIPWKVSGPWSPQTILGEHYIWTALSLLLLNYTVLFWLRHALRDALRKSSESLLCCLHFGEELVWYEEGIAHCPFMSSHRGHFGFQCWEELCHVWATGRFFNPIKADFPTSSIFFSVLAAGKLGAWFSALVYGMHVCVVSLAVLSSFFPHLYLVFHFHVFVSYIFLCFFKLPHLFFKKQDWVFIPLSKNVSLVCKALASSTLSPFWSTEMSESPLFLMSFSSSYLR